MANYCPQSAESGTIGRKCGQVGKYLPISCPYLGAMIADWLFEIDFHHCYAQELCVDPEKWAPGR
jgi:hypothetical protein